MPRKVKKKPARTAEERAARERYCRRLVAEQPRSGLSLEEFAAKHGMSSGAFAYWRRKLARSHGSARKRHDSTKPQFVQVSLTGSDSGPGSPAPGAYEIVLGAGRVLRLPADFDEGRVSALLRILAAC